MCAIPEVITVISSDSVISGRYGRIVSGASVCDMKMPAMAGDMFYLAVQKTKPELANRFIFVTAHSDDPDIERFTTGTGRQTLVKPVQTQDLIHAIGLVLQESQNLEKTEL